MDKKVDEELLDRPVDIRLKLSRQSTPDGETYHRTNVQHHPDNSLSFCNDDTGETVVPRLLVINQRNLLFVCLERPLTTGTWTVSLATQFNRTYHLYKTPRHASFTFEVTE